MRRSLALEVGFSPNLPASEDGEFSYRFLKHGFSACYFPSRYSVLDEQYYDLRGLISYFRKLGLAGVVLLRSTGSLRVARNLIKTLIEPMSPHYLVVRYKKARNSASVSFRTWLFAGLTRVLSMASTAMLYGPLGWRLPSRIQRKKA